MGFSKFTTIILLVLGLMSLAGCGGSGTGGGADPLAQQNEVITSTTPTGPGTVTGYDLSLSTIGSSGTTTVGANSTVIATATLKDSDGNPVAGQPIQFEEVSATPGDASVTIPAPIVPTSSGVASTFLNTAATTVNKDVIIKASTSIGGQTISAVSIFKIARSTGNYIDFITTKETTDPDGNLNEESVTIDAIDPVQIPSYNILQLAPFQVLDRNGIPRTLVPVQVSIYSLLGGCTVFNDSPESSARTVTTDNTGLGVFNSYVTVPTPPPGSKHSCSIMYKATTPDPYATEASDQLFSYGAYIVTLENLKP